MTNLFQHSALEENGRLQLAEQAYLYPAMAKDLEADLLGNLSEITSCAPLRHMKTPGGYEMSVAMTNCGPLGWVTDALGYRYSDLDPVSGRPWPKMPSQWRTFAVKLAMMSGFEDFQPDACLINQYRPGSKLSLHQDKDEINKTQPIVSISLGLPARFQFGGLRRKDPLQVHELHHTDAVVWGGTSRLCYHGILTLKKGEHPVVGSRRLNLTFRQAR